MATKYCDYTNGHDASPLTNWVTATSYVVGNQRKGKAAGAYVTIAYICILDHTSAAGDEPGVGANWTTYWAIQGDGSASLPYASTLDASTAALVSGEIRVAGSVLIALGDGIWTKDSVTVTFATDQSAVIKAGDWIMPTLTDSAPYRVNVDSVYSGGVTTVTLTVAFRLASGTYASNKWPTITLTANQTLASLANQSISFGWKLADETQPADWVTAFTGNFNFGSGNALACFTINANGRLAILNAGDSYCLNLGGSYGQARVNGITYCANTTKVMVYVSNASEPGRSTYGYVEEIRASRAGYVGGQGYADGVYIRRAVVHQCTSIFASKAGVHCGEIVVIYGAPVLGYGDTGIRIGLLNVGANALTFDSGTVASGGPTIGYLICSGVITYGKPVNIAAPAALWRMQDMAGITTLTTGRGGSGYGLVINPSQRHFPTVIPIIARVAVGGAITLTFYAYYSGTPADVPPMVVVLREPNGLGIAEAAVTLVNGDGWDHATQLSAVFTGTTAQAGLLTAELRVRDNVAGNALVYVDDVAWAVA